MSTKNTLIDLKRLLKKQNKLVDLFGTLNKKEIYLHPQKKASWRN